MCAETESKLKAAAVSVDMKEKNRRALIDNDEEEQRPASRNPSFEKDRHLGESMRDFEEPEFEAFNNNNPMSCAQGPLCQGELGDLMGIPSCQIAEQIEMMTVRTMKQHLYSFLLLLTLTYYSFYQQCGSSLDIWTIMFQEKGETSHEFDEIVRGVGQASFYSLKESCEYCGSPSTKDCTLECQRPRLFLRKKRPPFCPKSDCKWDSETDYEITREVEESHEVELKPVRRRSSFLSSLFAQPPAAP